MAAHEGDGLLKVLSCFGFECVEAVADLIDEAADAADLFLGGHGFGAGPMIEFGGGEQSFAGPQEVVEVGVEVGQVGDVGAEVVAADAAEPERAGAAAGFDVGRFGADAERDGDLTDGAAGVSSAWYPAVNFEPRSISTNVCVACALP